jgi:hypothetical protein
MNITEDVRQYAIKNGYGVEESTTKGMEDMSKLYKGMGNQLYSDKFENTINPLDGLAA